MSAPSGPFIPRTPDQLLTDVIVAVNSGNIRSAAALALTLLEKGHENGKIIEAIHNLHDDANKEKISMLLTALTHSDIRAALLNIIVNGQLILNETRVGGSKYRRRSTKRRSTKRRRSTRKN